MMDPVGNCVVCKEKQPVHACPKFKLLSHDKMVLTLKANNVCMNCLRSGHFIKQCRSFHRCRKCQKPHHTLLHVDTKDAPPSTDVTTSPLVNPATSNAAVGFTSGSLLMMCRILANAPDGSPVEA